MKTNVYQYLKSVVDNRYYGNISSLIKELEIRRILNGKKERINVINKKGVLIQIVDKKSDYEKRKRNKLGWLCKR